MIATVAVISLTTRRSRGVLLLLMFLDQPAQVSASRPTASDPLGRWRGLRDPRRETDPTDPE
jgi:hypothetical protein